MKNLLLLIILLLSAASCSTSVTSIKKTDKVYTMDIDKPWYYYEIYVDKKGNYFIYKTEDKYLKKVYFPKECKPYLDNLKRNG
jgi:hypothetical protein